jgi:N-methylhydantoinase B
MSGATIDPITLEVVRNKLESISNEMQFTLLHCAFSPLVKEGMDCSAALFTPQGEVLAQATAIPVHLGTMVPAVTSILREYPPERMREGRSYILNDPYCGGSHLPDITILMPAYAAGRILAYCVTTVHHQDVGGMAIGSLPSAATEVFQEGLRLPPLEFADGGQVDEALEKILRLNSRTPDALMGDLHAQLSACKVAERRLGELAAKYGEASLGPLFAELLDRSEKLTRAAIRALPQGTFRCSDWLDNDGVELDKRIPIAVAVTVDGDTIHYDFTGCSPQVRGPINCVPAGARAAVNYSTRALTDPAIPTNGGCFRPISLTLPEGSIVNPAPPAAVNARLVTIKRLCAVIVAAFAEVMPEKVPAMPGNVLTVLTFGGRRANGTPFMVSELIAAGSGASYGADGVDCVQTDGSNSMNLPVEALMMEAPIKVRRFTLRTDSGGAGKYRGGLGVYREYEFLVDDVRIGYRGERHYTQAAGSQGGHPGASSRACIVRADGTSEPIRSKAMLVAGKGDRLIVETAGAGGYGDPRLRDAAARESDVENRKVARAREAYTA